MDEHEQVRTPFLPDTGTPGSDPQPEAGPASRVVLALRLIGAPCPRVPDDGSVGADSGRPAALDFGTLGKGLRLVTEPSCRAQKTVLDTFDRALARNGTVLEATKAASALRLRWRRNDGELLFDCEVEALPRFAYDLPLSTFRAALAKCSGVRALLPIAEGRAQLTCGRVLDARDKTVVRLEQWLPDGATPAAKRRRAHEVGGAYIHLLPMKGFDKALEQARRVLLRHPDVETATQIPLPKPSARCVHFGPPRSTYEHLDPGERADTGWRRVLAGLSRALEDNHRGIVEDIDTECLHEFRVACRRSRSLLARAEGVFPLKDLRRFGAAFSWLSEETGPVRDLDVFILELEARERAGDVFASRVLPRVRTERKRCFKQLLRALHGARYCGFMTAWTQFLASPPATHTTLPLARRRLGEVAGVNTQVLYAKLLKRGRALDANTPLAAVHDWRKLAKKLRYLLDAFGGLYPGKSALDTRKRLKKLQTYLGELQDLSTQSELLMALIAAPLDPAGGETNAAAELDVEIAARASRLQHEAEIRKREVASRFSRFDIKRRHRSLRRTLAPTDDAVSRASKASTSKLARRRKRTAKNEKAFGSGSGSAPNRGSGLHRGRPDDPEHDAYVSVALSRRH